MLFDAFRQAGQAGLELPVLVSRGAGLVSIGGGLAGVPCERREFGEFARGYEFFAVGDRLGDQAGAAGGGAEAAPCLDRVGGPRSPPVTLTSGPGASSNVLCPCTWRCTGIARTRCCCQWRCGVPARVTG